MKTEIKTESAFSVEVSQNGKTGPLSVTYASQDSCDSECAFYKDGCYAESGMVGIHTARVNKASKDQTAKEIAIVEAKAIDNLTGRMDLRVHVVGDCKTAESADIVSQAMKRHRKKKGKSAYTYTHAWKKVGVSSWNGESVLASCETVEGAALAMSFGYAAAIVLESFDGHTKKFVKDGVKILPCLNQTKDIQCVDCRICFETEPLLRTKTVIGFLAHGTSKNKVVAKLQKLNIKPKINQTIQLV